MQLTEKGRVLAAGLGLLGSLLASASPNAQGTDNGTAYYGDAINDLIYVIDVDQMQLIKAFQSTQGSKPYPVDHASDGKTYVSTRGVQSISVINNHDHDEPLYQIPLAHTPRSATYNPDKGLAAISGGDIPMTTVIKSKNDQIETAVGGGPGWNSAVNTDFGGSNATGHPFWHKQKDFFLLNRVARRIELYKHYGELVGTLYLPTTAHHLLRLPSNDRHSHSYLAALEGNPAAGIAPGVLQFDVSKDGNMTQTGLLYLDCSGCDPAAMGGHHADIDPSGEYLYMGSNEGRLFIVELASLSIVAVIDSGTGSGHTRFVPSRHLAVVTNHNDRHMTLIDTDTLSKTGDVVVASDCARSGLKTQGHTTGLSPDERYFYGAASCDGKLFRIDLDTLGVTHLDLTQALQEQGISPATGKAYPIQGASYRWQ